MQICIESTFPTTPWPLSPRKVSNSILGELFRRFCYMSKTTLWARFSNILEHNSTFVSLTWARFQNFLHNKALRSWLEGSGIFSGLKSGEIYLNPKWPGQCFEIIKEFWWGWNQGWGWKLALLKSSWESARTEMTLTELKPTLRSILELLSRNLGKF